MKRLLPAAVILISAYGCATTQHRIVDPVNDAVAINERMLAQAKERGYLPHDAIEMDMTMQVRQRLLDDLFLRDAIACDYLPRDATTRDLTLEVRERMLQGGDLCDYMPDGSRYTARNCPTRCRQ